MIIYISKFGKWWYSWDTRPAEIECRAVDLDRWYEYNLNELEVLACLEALEE